MLWHVNTDKTKTLLHRKISRFVKFIQIDHILYHLNDAAGGVFDEIRIMNMKGEDLRTFNTRVDPGEPKLLVLPKYLITAECDGSFRVHSRETSDVVYVFVFHHTQGFNSFFLNSCNNTFTAFNDNGMSFVFDNIQVLESYLWGGR